MMVVIEIANIHCNNESASIVHVQHLERLDSRCYWNNDLCVGVTFTFDLNAGNVIGEAFKVCI